MNLGRSNYYTLKNQYLTSSKMKDFIKDPNYFWRKHVAGTLIEPTTPSMLIGSAVDCWITESENQFSKKFVVVSRRNLKNPPTKYRELSEPEMNTAVKMVNALKQTSVIKQIEKDKFKSQQILRVDSPLGMFPGLAGIPDWFKLDKRTRSACVIDLKSTTSVEEQKFKNTCRDLKYYFQQGFYRKLLKTLNPWITEFHSYILAVENKEPYRVKLFKLGQDKLDLEQVVIEHNLLKISSYGTDPNKFISPDVSFGTAIEL